MEFIDSSIESWNEMFEHLSALFTTVSGSFAILCFMLAAVLFVFYTNLGWRGKSRYYVDEILGTMLLFLSFVGFLAGLSWIVQRLF